MFCCFRCFSLVYCLVAFFDRMDEKIHIRTILAHYCPIYRVAVGSEKDFWTM